MMNNTQSVQASIEKTLQTLSPSYLEIKNESHMHSVPKDSETHFKITIVTEQFNNKRLVARHQMIYQSLADLMKNPIHALALHTFTPDEWESAEIAVPDSPNCLGGSKHDK